jgi:hypothetical protein
MIQDRLCGVEKLKLKLETGIEIEILVAAPSGVMLKWWALGVGCASMSSRDSFAGAGRGAAGRRRLRMTIRATAAGGPVEREG